MQTSLYGLRVDQQAIAVNLYRTFTVCRDVDGVNAGFGHVDGQAVGAAVHHAQRGIGAGAEGANLTGQAFGAGGEIAEAKKAAFELTLGIGLMHGVIERGVVWPASAGQLQI